MSAIGSLGMKSEGPRDKRLLIASFGLLLLMAGVCAAQVPGAVEKQLEVSRAQQKAQCLKACRRNLDTLSEACAHYSAEHGRFPEQCSQLVPKYLSRVPRCSGSQSETYLIRSGTSSGSSNFQLECQASHERVAARPHGLESLLTFPKTAK